VTHEIAFLAYEGEEYDVLLRYAQDEANKLRNSRDDADDDEDEEHSYIRPWYKPWQKVKKPSTQAKKVRKNFTA
jgi:H+-transporting ATPase